MKSYKYKRAVQPVQLAEEIRDQLDKKIMAKFEGEKVDGYFNLVDDDLELVFYAALTKAQKAKLDEIVANHVPQPLADPLKGEYMAARDEFEAATTNTTNTGKITAARKILKALAKARRWE